MTGETDEHALSRRITAFELDSSGVMRAFDPVARAAQLQAGRAALREALLAGGCSLVEIHTTKLRNGEVGMLAEATLPNGERVQLEGLLPERWQELKSTPESMKAIGLWLLEKNGLAHLALPGE